MLEPMPFGDLPGWAEGDHRDALAAFARHAALPPHPDGALGVHGTDLQALAWRAAALMADAVGGAVGTAEARAFFETSLQPFRVAASEPPFVTGYYEPEVDGALAPSDAFPVPLRAAPPNLVAVGPAAIADGIDAGASHALRGADGRHRPCPDRAAIEAGALDAVAPAVAWIADPIDAFFIHVQGSARIRLAGGRVLRLAYAGKSGHPYTSLGRLLVARGAASADEMTADRLRALLAAMPDRGRTLMHENRSYVFFRVEEGLAAEGGARGAAGVPLTPRASLAVDRRLHTYGTPVFIDADLPTGEGGALQPFRRLLIADDTGSAIVGPARGDIFFGTGEAAGAVAGRIRHHPRAFVVFVPRDGASPGHAP